MLSLSFNCRTYGSSSITKSTTSTESIADEIVEPGFRRDTASFAGKLYATAIHLKFHFTFL